ncbi:hypothetical protein [Halobacillus litoralis]|uniref:hypothetical protein n=1 Tax=Halobacillus litoralis TaxID=45668 RepID=UPI001CFD1CCB|nr:hypothetical protein [Halobacillus litoralis]
MKRDELLEIIMITQKNFTTHVNLKIVELFLTDGKNKDESRKKQEKKVIYP